jgi:hypothetical protein
MVQSCAADRGNDMRYNSKFTILGCVTILALAGCKQETTYPVTGAATEATTTTVVPVPVPGPTETVVVPVPGPAQTVVVPGPTATVTATPSPETTPAQ